MSLEARIQEISRQNQEEQKARYAAQYPERASEGTARAGASPMFDNLTSLAACESALALIHRELAVVLVTIHQPTDETVLRLTQAMTRLKKVQGAMDVLRARATHDASAIADAEAAIARARREFSERI